MSILRLGAGDELRFERLNASVVAVISTISEDSLELQEVDGKFSVIIPVYGSPYLKFENPIGSAFSKMTLGIEASQTAFDALTALVSVGNVAKVSLVVGGVAFSKSTLFSGVVTGVRVTNSLVKSTGWVTGQISLIKV